MNDRRISDSLYDELAFPSRMGYFHCNATGLVAAK